MNFNPDTTKHAKEVIFSCKLKKTVHPPLLFKGLYIKYVGGGAGGFLWVS